MEEKVQNTEPKKASLLRRHWVLFVVLAVMLISTFFVRGGSVKIRCSAGEDYDEIRLDYSIYGYLINVRPEEASSVEEAKQLSREMLFMGMDKSVTYVVEKWGTEKENASFNFKVKGYTYKTTDRRDELIRMVRDLGYPADAII